MFKRMDIKVKIALVYSVILIIMGIGVAVFISFSLQSSMKNQPVTQSIETVTYAVTVKGDKNNSAIVYQVPEIVSQKEGTFSITGDQLNQFLSSEVFKRLVRYSIIAVVIVLVSTFLIGYNVSKWLLKPLTSMAKITHQISADNLALRLAIPESNDELRELSQSFNTTMDGLQNAFLELERFNAYASHELKNALAVLKTRLEVDYRETDCRETINFAINQVNKITKSINDILAISATTIKDSSELVDIAMAAAEVVDEYQATGRTILLDIPEDGVLPVRGKEIWFQRIIANLVDNAIKHSDEASPITIRIKQQNEAVIIVVTDSGRGIAGSNQERIWEPYFSTSTDWEKGYGLGLAMVNHIVDICGGIVWMDSKEGEGSSFYISLPVTRK